MKNVVKLFLNLLLAAIILYPEMFNKNNLILITYGY